MGLKGVIFNKAVINCVTPSQLGPWKGRFWSSQKLLLKTKFVQCRDGLPWRGVQSAALSIAVLIVKGMREIKQLMLNGEQEQNVAKTS